MLLEDFLETENKSVRQVIIALQCLKKLQFDVYRDDIIESVQGTSHTIDLSCTIADTEYWLTVSSSGSNALSIKIFDNDGPSGEYVVICMNSKRILTIKSNILDSYSSIEWLMIVCKNGIITNEDLVIEKKHVLENRFQYDTVSPLASLLLDFWGE